MQNGYYLLMYSGLIYVVNYIILNCGTYKMVRLCVSLGKRRFELLTIHDFGGCLDSGPVDKDQST